MQEAEKDQIGAGLLQSDNALGNLLRRADQVGAETVIVLDEVVEGGFRPVALAFRRGLAGVLHLMAECLDGFRIGFLDDLGKNRPGFLFRLAHDREGVDADAHMMAVRFRLGLDVVHLPGNLRGRITIGEIPVGYARGHVAGRARRATLKDFWLRIDRLRLQRIVSEPIEIAAEGEAVLRPDATQRTNKLFRAAIALVVIEPWLANGLEFTAEPAADDVDRDAAIGQVVDRGDLLGRQRRRPWAGQDRRNDFQLGCRLQQSMAEGDGFMLIFGTIAGGETDLAQRIVETTRLGDLRKLSVVVDRPAGALLDVRNDQPA